MAEASERAREASPDQNGKRKYEPPEILGQEIFETTALACGKLSGQCGSKPKVS